jgi:hypothetical protein
MTVIQFLTEKIELIIIRHLLRQLRIVLGLVWLLRHFMDGLRLYRGGGSTGQLPPFPWRPHNASRASKRLRSGWRISCSVMGHYRGGGSTGQLPPVAWRPHNASSASKRLRSSWRISCSTLGLRGASLSYPVSRSSCWTLIGCRSALEAIAANRTSLGWSERWKRR